MTLEPLSCSPEPDLGRGDVLDRQLAVCPACGSDQLEPVVGYGAPEVNSYCRSCSRCWHVELGHVLRITPPICFGCHERECCETVYEADQTRAQRS